MRKNLLSILAASALLFAATSCSEDEELLTGGNGNSEKVSFQVEMDGTGPTSRADLKVGEGTKANKLYYEVYDLNTGEKVYDATEGISENVNGGKRGANIQLELVKGVPYDILFWAHNEEGSVFNANDLKAVTMNTTALKANMEDYDAFTAALNGYKVQSGSKTIVPLKRPFAQVNVGTTQADWEKAVNLKVVIDKTQMTIKGVNTKYDVSTATASEPTTLTYALNDLIDQDNKLEIKKDKDSPVEYYQYLGLNYMLANAESSMNDMEFELHDGEYLINTIKVANLPIRRNYRTNVIGNLLTSDEGFEVVIDAEFDGNYFETAWDGSVKKPGYDDTNKTWTIKSASELAWIAGAVNGTLKENERSASEPKDFLGETVVLVNDIDLQNHGWMPIGHGDDAYKINFQGTFDGQGHTISNLNVTNESCAGLFGQMVKGTIKNVNIKNVTISTNHYAGAIVGWAEQGGGNIVIENCHVDGGTITVTPDFNSGIYDNGDKAGGLVGFLYAGTINNSTVKNLAITAYRDLGGIVGYASKATVTGNVVENVSMAVDQSANPYKDAPKDANVGEIIGRTGDANTTNPDNTATNVTIASKISSTDAELTAVPDYDEPSKTYTADNAQEFLWLMHAVNGTLPAESKSVTAPKDFAGQIFKLACNVDLGGIEWTPIGEDKEKRFMGTFDGGGFTISNLKITKRTNGKPQAALFGALAGSVTIKDLTLENVDIIYPNDGKDFYGAALVATYYGHLTVNNVKVVNANITGNNKVAGLIAHDGASSTLNVDNCHVENSTIASTDKNDGGNVGGLLGYFQGNGNTTHTIKNSSVKNCIINGINSSNSGKRANSEFIGGIHSKAGQVLEITNCTIENNTFTDVQSDGSKVTYPSPYAPFERYIGGARDEVLNGTVIVDGHQFIADGCWLYNNEYYISNANGLKWVAEQVNTMEYYVNAAANILDDKTVILTNDINLNGEEWTPIGDYAFSRTIFRGIFDGDGHTISNFKITQKNAREQKADEASYGLFGNMNGTIKNLKIDNATIAPTGGRYAGVLVGRLNGESSIENCHITASTVTISHWQVGGLVGQWNNGKISGCSVEGTTITGYAAAGAIAGIALTTGTRTIENSSVMNCTLAQNGNFSDPVYDEMFGAILGATNGNELTVNLNECTVENTTVLGEKSNVLCGYVSEGDKLIIDGYEMVSDGLLKNGVEYNVSNANGLATLNKMMADKSAGRDAVVNLTADIDFTGYEWTPVDSHADTEFEIAEINGNKHTISNFTINGQAMFTRFAGTGDVVIKDVTFDNATVNSNGKINTSILTVQSYQNVLLDNVDVKNSSITGGYKVAPLIATVYNESSSTVTATLKNCDVENVTVKAVTYDFCTTGMVAFVYADYNAKIEFENCTVKDVKLIAPDDNYDAHAAIYTTGSGSLFNEAEGVTVSNVTFEKLN